MGWLSESPVFSRALGCLAVGLLTLLSARIKSISGDDTDIFSICVSPARSPACRLFLRQKAFTVLNCSVAYVILTHQSDPPLLIFCHGMLQSEGACIVHLLQNPQDKNRCFGNRDNKKMRLCPKVNPHDSIRVLICGLRTGIPSGLAPGAQSFRTGSPSSGGFHPFRSGWIGGESFPPTSILFWKADP